MASSKLTKAQKISLVETDMITNLPEDVRQRILTCLPIKEAGRTSILSRKWRYIWASIPDLIFGDFRTSLDLDKFVDAILLLHSGPIRKFNLSIRIYYPEAFDRWIVNLSRNGIRELTLEFCSETVNVNPAYVMHSKFFSCDELNYINLTNCSFRVPDEFRGFKSLHTLELKGLKISDGEIEKLISSCPLLKKLILNISCNLDNRSINIHAPNLLSLKIRGAFTDLHLCAPKLLILCVQLDIVNWDLQKKNNRFPCINFKQVLGNLPNLESLELGGFFSEHLHAVPLKDVFPFTFNHLKNLDIDLEFEGEKIAAFVLTLFHGVPHLESLYISVYSDEIPTLKFWETVDKKEGLFKHLKMVMIDDFRGGDAIFSFVKFVLDSAPQLEALTIEEDRYFKEDDGTIILKQLLSLRRGSKKAQIFFE